MVAGATSPNAARKAARERAVALLDAEDAERRRAEAVRRKRISDHAGAIAGNDAEVTQLSEKIAELHADSAKRLAAIVADGVSEAQTAEMTGREPREVKAAIKSTAGEPARAIKKTSTTRRASTGDPGTS